MSKLKNSPRAGSTSKNSKSGDPSSQPMAGRGTRETIESIVIAVILAFLFRAFEAEAFVIPTGSMAPTLQGQHVDFACPQCKHWYRVGASENHARPGSAVCPICRYETIFEPKDPVHAAVTGDRILVSKFAYQGGVEPQRWDVIVFKYPGNAKQNFIKRLIGLPGERIRIWRGNIYVKKAGDAGFRIARKTEAGPGKLKAMLQLIDDTNHIPQDLVDSKFPSRWREWLPQGDQQIWTASGGGRRFSANAGGESWLRYHHTPPTRNDWWEVENGDAVNDGPRPGGLVGDFCAYNAHDTDSPFWVGDLALECDVEVTGDSGELLLKLVRAGVDYDCRIDVATGEATLSIEGGTLAFEDRAGKTTLQPKAASTGIRGAGKYHLRFSNVDDELVLWVNDSPVEFGGPTTYVSEISAHVFPEAATDAPIGLGAPEATSRDPGDLAPAGVGANGVGLEVSRLRIFRDVYYTQPGRFNDLGGQILYRRRVDTQQLEVAPGNENLGWDVYEDIAPIDQPLTGPLGEGQYFPMGDNSPQSKDARLWHIPERDNLYPPQPYVEREFLIGKAVFIYWPHPWYGFMPNFGRMGFIR